jgi:hypothetical protein
MLESEGSYCYESSYKKRPGFPLKCLRVLYEVSYLHIHSVGDVMVSYASSPISGKSVRHKATSKEQESVCLQNMKNVDLYISVL